MPRSGPFDKKLARSSTLKRGIYENYIEGVLSKSQYLSAKEEYTKTEAAFQQQIDALLSQKRCMAEHLTLNNRWLKDFLNDERGMELSKKCWPVLCSGSIYLRKTGADHAEISGWIPSAY